MENKNVKIWEKNKLAHFRISGLSAIAGLEKKLERT